MSWDDDWGEGYEQGWLIAKEQWEDELKEAVQRISLLEARLRVYEQFKYDETSNLP